MLLWMDELARLSLRTPTPRSLVTKAIEATVLSLGLILTCTEQERILAGRLNVEQQRIRSIRWVYPCSDD